MKRVSNVAKASPNAMLTAIGFQLSTWLEVDRRIGINPAMVVTVVIRIGRSRTVPALIREFHLSTPFSLSLFTKSTRISESFTTTPARASTAIRVIIENGSAVMIKPNITPMMAKGIVSITMKGCT